MISEKKAKKIILKCEKSEKFKTSTMYSIIMIISILLAIFLFVMCKLQGIGTIQSFKNAAIGFIGVNIGLFFMYFLLNRYSITLSLKNITILIYGFKNVHIEDIENLFVDRSFTIHPLILSHPVTLYFLGRILLVEGYEEDGNYLINKAEQKNSNLANIKQDHPLKFVDLEYLLKLLQEDEKLKNSYKILNLWRLKLVRSSILLIGALILILYYLNQIMQIIDKFRK
jgi:hypothetical protein